jgi:hypothetical protein
VVLQQAGQLAGGEEAQPGLAPLLGDRQREPGIVRAGLVAQLGRQRVLQDQLGAGGQAPTAARVAATASTVRYMLTPSQLTSAGRVGWNPSAAR